jgi:hypothetical protein
MFTGVNEKLERAAYFLNNLKALTDEAGGFAYIKRDKQQAMRANLDGFFFEIISAKDFFLQGINDRYGLGLSRRNTTITKKLIAKLKCWGIDAAFSHKVKIDLVTDDKELFNKIQQGELVIKPIFEGQEKEIPPDVKRVDIPLENVKTYLFKDPEDPSQGDINMEVIPYCEQSLETMRNFLEELYSKLSI